MTHKGPETWSDCLESHNEWIVEPEDPDSQWRVPPTIICCLFNLLNMHHGEPLSGLDSEMESSWGEGGKQLLLFNSHHIGSGLLQVFFFLRDILENTRIMIVSYYQHRDTRQAIFDESGKEEVKVWKGQHISLSAKTLRWEFLGLSDTDRAQRTSWERKVLEPEVE